MFPPEVITWLATWPLWAKVNIGILGFFLFIYLMVRVSKSAEEDHRRQERAMRDYKIATGHDPTYDEYGRLRK